MTFCLSESAVAWSIESLDPRLDLDLDLKPEEIGLFTCWKLGFSGERSRIAEIGAFSSFIPGRLFLLTMRPV
jgi:hypothetical protein